MSVIVMVPLPSLSSFSASPSTVVSEACREAGIIRRNRARRYVDCERDGVIESDREKVSGSVLGVKVEQDATGHLIFASRPGGFGRCGEHLDFVEECSAPGPRPSTPVGPAGP